MALLNCYSFFIGEKYVDYALSETHLQQWLGYKVLQQNFKKLGAVLSFFKNIESESGFGLKRLMSYESETKNIYFVRRFSKGYIYLLKFIPRVAIWAPDLRILNWVQVQHVESESESGLVTTLVGRTMKFRVGWCFSFWCR